MTITKPGQYCFKKDLQTSISDGEAIRIDADFVTIDMNGFKLGGLAGGPSTGAFGIFTHAHRNVTIRNGTIRGFGRNIAIGSTFPGNDSSGHIVENVRSENARRIGIQVQGWRLVVRNNIIVNTFSTFNSVTGLHIANSRGSLITANVISGLEAQMFASGIILLEIDGVIVEGNKIYDLTAPTTQGIWSNDTGRVVAAGNVVANRTGGTSGIELLHTDDVCVDNIATGFTTPYSGCENENGNSSF